MFYYYIWNSDKERLAKRIMTKQAETKFQNSWYTELEKIVNEYKKINDGKYISNIKKSEWKAEIKNKIVNYLEKTDQNEKRHKARFHRNYNWTNKKYLTELEANGIINLRLNMINDKGSHKNNEIDTICEYNHTFKIT